MELTDEIPDLQGSITVMLEQESTKYRCRDYLAQPPVQSAPATGNSTSEGSSASNLSSSSRVNEMWREKICKWKFHILDHFDINREIVSISMSFLDRFLSIHQVNQKVFQLAAMTTLFLAIKLNKQGSLKVSSLIELSRGCFKAVHIAVMEKHILRDLSWHVHPPTPHCFVRHFLCLVPFSGSIDDNHLKRETLDLSLYSVELSVCDYFFVACNPSSVALASIMNALDSILMNSSQDKRKSFLSMKTAFIENIENVIPQLEISSNSQVEDCRLRLKDIFRHAAQEQQRERQIRQQQVASRVENTISPTCVSGATHPYTSQQHDFTPRKRGRTTSTH
mmetsp:Transcript_15649/g.23036  ORF Transcript_15649/g.23036 Transcript_15649/m.23036 type:complete len:336 (+) Transcript_15649:119-1126(+)|eukprot:CAMPEP_0195521168 /NCGR_PEP_ID=MMETSP0794_2-20130614/18143_1 /TAXON_ID=515487 /ORGANISM="Stephanopyxis turris, Strain CCMP 815" /LENGTH=335 /DNA_ID=CAMNT_0040650669 /DNA_START=118 /DNA_END=1125 /DNA_ORIENTATION=+